jgi:hypothetical protein
MEPREIEKRDDTVRKVAKVYVQFWKFELGYNAIVALAALAALVVLLVKAIW